MKCKVCGGDLVFSDGCFRCENCGNTVIPNDSIKNTEVFICYIESDVTGRRTKDSILAQEIYQLLSNHKIQSYYARTDAANMAGNDAEQMAKFALYYSKVVLIIGTNKDNYETLDERYQDKWQGKVIIPVFMEMNANDIPKSISSIQALDYGKIGAGFDLVKGLLNALGRDQEIDFVRLTKRSRIKKRTGIIAVSLVVALVAVASILFMVFRPSDSAIQSEEKVDQQTLDYERAVDCAEKGKYGEAINLFYNLGDYRDSKKQLSILQTKYVGYYQDEKTATVLHFQVWDEGVGNVEIIKNTESGAQCKIVESAPLSGKTFELQFNDSENNQGDVTLLFNNDGFTLSVKTDVQNSKVSMGSFQADYLLADKSEKSFGPAVDAQTLLSFVRSRTTLSQLKQLGYDLESDRTLYRNKNANLYNVKDTKISFAIFTYDITKYTLAVGDITKRTLDSEINMEQYLEDEPIVYGVSAPASIMLPDHIGQSCEPFVQDDILYFPNAYFIQDYVTEIYNYEIDFYSDGEQNGTIQNEIIQNNTIICFVSKNTVGDELFSKLVDKHCNHQKEVEETYYDDNRNDTSNYESESGESVDSGPVENSPYTLDTSPNVWCPSCGKGMFITGVGNNGLTCQDCGCIWMPTCYICNNENAASIMVAETEDHEFIFKCNICGGEWTP